MREVLLVVLGARIIYILHTPSGVHVPVAGRCTGWHVGTSKGTEGTSSIPRNHYEVGPRYHLNSGKVSTKYGQHW